ncbi:hypothetical protein BHE74_00051238 [Ensete ventricosum]|nr:hypothetical protein BHE74_00051238 [Ensete ventricosum]
MSYSWASGRLNSLRQISTNVANILRARKPLNRKVWASYTICCSELPKLPVIFAQDFHDLDNVSGCCEYKQVEVYEVKRAF